MDVLVCILLTRILLPIPINNEHIRYLKIWTRFYRTSILLYRKPLQLSKARLKMRGYLRYKRLIPCLTKAYGILPRRLSTSQIA
jgi:hypothetical protein